MRFSKTLASKAYISALAFGDLNGKPSEEIVVGTSDKGVVAFDARGKRLWRVKAKSPRISKKKAKKNRMWHPRYKMEQVQSICLTDLTGDSVQEVGVGSRPYRMVTVLNNKGQIGD